MNITELEIRNICECKHAVLKFDSSDAQKTPLYIVHSNKNCEVITLSLQLICGVKYSHYNNALHEIRNKISNGKINVKFSLLKPTDKSSCEQEHSSDSDVPCTSQQARLRLENRLKRSKIRNRVIVNACRDFSINPNVIAYTVDDGPQVECSVLSFQIRFFTCTDVIFPRLTNITYGEYCNGKWLDFLNTEVIDRETDGNNLIIEFCRLHANRKISNNDLLNELTKSVFAARNFLNTSRISHIINIFNDIRWLFEFMTCSEYTVWFLLPSDFGNLEDISTITADNTNFDLMTTQIQLKEATVKPIDWTQAEKHVQEIFLIAVQLAFGYHCQQNVIFLHSLENLEKHQSFEYFNFMLLQSSHDKQIVFEKNYLNRIMLACAELKLCCVLEYSGGFLSYPSKGFVIDCRWLDTTNEWVISAKDHLSSSQNIAKSANDFIKNLESTF